MEKLTILRMNKPFMQFMRKEYKHLSRQQFNRTLAANLPEAEKAGKAET